jgi:hypothetical protein
MITVLANFVHFLQKLAIFLKNDVLIT